MNTYRIVESQDTGNFSIDKWHSYWFGGGQWRQVADHYIGKITEEPYFVKVNFTTYEEAEQYLFRFYVTKSYTQKVCSTYEEEIPCYY